MGNDADSNHRLCQLTHFFNEFMMNKYFQDWRYANLGIKSPALELLTRADKAAYGPSDCKYWYPCDSFAAFVFLNPEKYITKRSSHNAVVELRGELTRGQLLLDHLNEHPHNVVIVEDFDAEKFKDLLLEIEEQAM